MTQQPPVQPATPTPPTQPAAQPVTPAAAPQPAAQPQPAQQAPQQPVEQKKPKSPMFWIAITLLVIGVLVACCCSISMYTSLTSAEFEDGFSEGYCEGLLEEGVPLEDDPLGICN